MATQPASPNIPHQQIVTAAAQKVVSTGGGVMPFQPSDKKALYQSYMPFIKNGGLYVPTPKMYDLGSEIFVLMKFPESNDRSPVVGKIIWVNRLASVSRPGGIGIQFLDTPENTVVRDRIETILAGMPDMPTYTM